MSVLIPLQVGGLLEGPLVGVAIVGGILALLVGVIGRIWIERHRNPFRPSIDQEPMEETIETDEQVRSSPEDLGVEYGRLLETASDRLARDEFRGSVQAAYVYTREFLAEKHDIESSGTHWDFYDRCAAIGLEGAESDLDVLTTIYERAVFDTEQVGREEAELAVDIASEISNGPPVGS